MSKILCTLVVIGTEGVAMFLPLPGNGRLILLRYNLIYITTKVIAYTFMNLELGGK